MAKGGYPRRGHRLAPRSLRALLDHPLPERFCNSERDRSLRLCDLDAGAWDRFGEVTCRDLAQLIVEIVGRNVRQECPWTERLPQLPAKIRLEDLGLETRTVNSLVAAGLHERPGDLCGMTIGEVLQLKGVWAKSLVDLLTALEEARDQPDSVGQASSPTTAVRVAIGRRQYPRPGFRIAPITLYPILQEPVPEAFLARHGLPALRLGDLDEMGWRVFTDEEIQELADRVVTQVGLGMAQRAIRDRRVPAPPSQLRLEDLGLERRTYNCLRRAGYHRRLDALGEARIADLLVLRAFGARCLVDLLTVLETLSADCDIEGRAMVRRAERLRATWATADVHVFDPRLGQLVRSVGVEGSTLAEVLENVVTGRVESTPSYEIACRLKRVHETLVSAHELSVREELAELLSAMFRQRDGQLVAQAQGWNDKGQAGVDELAGRHGLSSGRIRQICLQAARQAKTVPTYSPALDRAAHWLAERLPCERGELQRQWKTCTEISGGLGLEDVLSALDFFGKQVPAVGVEVGDGAVLVAPDHESLVREAWRIVRRLIHHREIGSTVDVIARVSRRSESTVRDLTRQIVSAAGSLEWLDASQTWFARKSPRERGLAQRVRAILAWVDRLDVNVLRGAVLRGQRTDCPLPPEPAFLEFCRRMDGVTVDGREVGLSASAGQASHTQGAETVIVRILHQHGPVLERHAWETLCIEAGVNRFTFRRVVAQSPMVVPLGRGFYGLLGHTPSHMSAKSRR